MKIDTYCQLIKQICLLL